MIICGVFLSSRVVVSLHLPPQFQEAVWLSTASFVLVERETSRWLTAFHLCSHQPWSTPPSSFPFFGGMERLSTSLCSSYTPSAFLSFITSSKSRSLSLGKSLLTFRAQSSVLPHHLKSSTQAEWRAYEAIPPMSIPTQSPRLCRKGEARDPCRCGLVAERKGHDNPASSQR